MLEALFKALPPFAASFTVILHSMLDANPTIYAQSTKALRSITYILIVWASYLIAQDTSRTLFFYSPTMNACLLLAAVGLFLVLIIGIDRLHTSMATILYAGGLSLAVMGLANLTESEGKSVIMIETQVPLTKLAIYRKGGEENAADLDFTQRKYGNKFTAYAVLPNEVIDQVDTLRVEAGDKSRMYTDEKILFAQEQRGLGRKYVFRYP